MAGQELLDQHNWDSKQLILMQWLVLSERQRRQLGLPVTEKELAVKLEVSDRTLRNWKSYPGFKADLSLMALQVMYDRLPRIVSASLDNMEQAEGWQERVAFYRYMLPALQRAKDTGLLDRVNQASNTSQLPQLAANELLAGMSPEQRQGALLFLERASLIESEQAEEHVVEGVVASLDDIADPEQAITYANVTRQISSKENKRTNKGYSKRNIKPLR